MSLASTFGQALWKTSPLAATAMVAGVGTAAYVGTNTFMNTEGDMKDKAANARDSSIRYGVGATLATMGGLTAYKWGAKPGGYLAGKTLRGAAVKGPSAMLSYAKGMGTDFNIGRGTETGLKGILPGLSRVGERKMFMTGLGSALGAVIGRSIDKDDPSKGAVIGAGVGAGAGLAVSAGLKASRVWGGLSGVSKTGLLGVATVAAYGVASIIGRPKNAGVDVAQREDNGLRERAASMNASGDLVFGLHRSR
jgi:hypothetical protein